MAESLWSLTPCSSFGYAQLAQCWQELEGRSKPACFQSWAWIGTWLECLPDDVAPRVAVRRENGVVTGLAMLCAARSRRHRILPLSNWHLTEAGRPDCDTLTVEHNAPLLAHSSPGFAAGLIDCLIAAAAWDELVLPGLDDSSLEDVRGAASARGLSVEEFDRKPWYWVDLDGLRGRGTEYLDALSNNTRYQIRRARRAYEKMGPLEISIARSVGEAREFFASLERLHQKYWVARGVPGAFANPFFRKFHERFIDTRFGAGNVELVRVTTGTQEVGYLYNLVLDGAVFAYQSGFAYTDQAHLKPGLVTHAACIEAHLRGGRRSYDFLAGRGQYKDSLSLESREMVWLRLQRPRLKLSLERRARSIWRTLREALPVKAPAPSAVAVKARATDAEPRTEASRSE